MNRESIVFYIRMNLIFRPLCFGKGTKKWAYGPGGGTVSGETSLWNEYLKRKPVATRGQPKGLRTVLVVGKTEGRQLF